MPAASAKPNKPPKTAPTKVKRLITDFFLPSTASTPSMGTGEIKDGEAKPAPLSFPAAASAVAGA